MPESLLAGSPLTTLVDELRTVGVGVSVGEHLDAAHALAEIPLADSQTVRASLQCALVKRAEHLDAFNLLFDLHFLGTGTDQSRPLSGLSADELESALREALGSLDATQLRLLAGNLIRRLNAELGDSTVRRVNVRGPGAPAARQGGLRVRGGRGPRDTYG